MNHRFLSYKKGLSLSCLTAILSSTAASAQVACETYELPFQPYSSSYQSQLTSPLLRRLPSSKDKSSAFSKISNEQLDRRQRTSLAQRFSEARAKTLGKTDDISKHLKQTFYNPDARYWEGRCHQWSAAALDSQIADLLKDFKGVVCGDELFTRGDIKELLTAFYPHQYQSAYGQRLDQEIAPAAYRLLYELGRDDLSPQSFDRAVVDNLGKGQGIVIDRAWGAEVFNHPVHRAKICRSTTNAKGLAETKHFSKLPLQILKARQQEDANLLATLIGIDKELVQKGYLTDAMDLSSAYEVLVEQLYTQGDFGENHKLVQGLIAKSSHNQDYLELRALLLNEYLQAQMAKGLLEVHPRYQLEEVQTELTYMGEVEFSNSDDRILSSDFTYWTVRDLTSKEIVSSRWISEPQDRVDYIWAPKQPDLTSGHIAEVLELVTTCEPLE